MTRIDEHFAEIEFRCNCGADDEQPMAEHDLTCWGAIMPRCSCGRLLSLAKQHGWYAHGEYGEDTGYVCPACLPNWTPRDSKGRGPEAGWCGIRYAPDEAENLLPACPDCGAPAGKDCRTVQGRTQPHDSRIGLTA